MDNDRAHVRELESKIREAVMASRPPEKEAATEPWEHPADRIVDPSTLDFGEPESEPKKNTNGAADAIPDALLARAREAGYTDEVIESLGTDSLTAALDAMDRAIIRSAGAESGDRADKTDEKPRKERRLDPYELPDDIEDSADVVEQLKAINQHYLGKFNDLVRHVEDLETRLSERLSSGERSDIDRFFDTLGESWQSIFGQGPTDQLPDNSPERLNRQSLLDHKDMLEQGYRQRGLRVPSTSEMCERAIRAAFPKQVQTLARKEVESQLKEREKSRISRPTYRQGHPDTARDAAIKAVGRRLREIDASRG